MDYDCRLSGDTLHCTITADRDLKAPIFCFSGMAPMAPVSGGQRIAGLGSFTEVALPDLQAGQIHDVVLRYSGGFTPANRAWMPLGPYLKVDGKVNALPVGDLGCRPHVLQDLGPFDGLPIMPQPQNWSAASGTFEGGAAGDDDPALCAVAALAGRRGLLWFDDGQGVHVETADLPDDAYELVIEPDRIVLRARDYGGRFYGGISLLHLLQAGPIPCGTLRDAPRFAWRGQHLDTARHFYQPQTILDLLDLMALLKLNRFHWHFADDEAFRLQIESYPELWQKTEMCGEGYVLPALFAGPPEAGGSYSKDDAANIIAHAKSLNIEVLPEIEVPAHAIALTHVFPDLRDPADNGAEVSVQGYRGNAVNPAMPKTWEVLEAIAAEVGAMFPFGHLHLGCDELPEGTWMGSPKARALMEEEGLRDTDDLQGWMMDRLAQIVAKNGQRPCAWEEAAKGSNGGINNNAILFSWTGQGPGVEAAKRGYDIVMTPGQHVYLDMAHTDDPDDWGASWAAFIPLSETINWDPVPDPSIANHVIGVQGTFWSEFTTKDDQLWPMLLPRMAGVATIGWQENTTSEGDFLRLVAATRWIMDRFGVTYVM